MFKRSLIIIPTFNERDNIIILLQKIKDLALPNLDILVVDDSSPDHTADLVEQWQQNNDNVYLIKRPPRSGFASAYVQGFDWGLRRNYDYFLQMDADLSHGPEYIPQMFEQIQNNDVVVGSRYIKGGGVKNWPIYRNLLSRFANIYVRLILNLPIRDCTGGFNLFSKNVLQAIDLFKIKSNGYSFMFELKYHAHKNKAKILESPIIFVERRDGQSKMSNKIILEAIWRTWWIKFFV